MTALRPGSFLSEFVLAWCIFLAVFIPVGFYFIPVTSYCWHWWRAL